MIHFFFIVTPDANLQKLLDECWIRVMTALKCAGTEALLDLLHNIMKLPRDPMQLYQVLDSMRQRFKGFKQDRISNLFPKNKMTDSKKLDINLLADIIVRISSCPKPTNQPLPDPDDVLSQLAIFPPTFSTQPNTADFVKWIKSLRNLMAHYGMEKISKELCDLLWKMLKYILENLNYDTTKLESFRNGTAVMQGPVRKVTAYVVLEYISLHLTNIGSRCFLGNEMTANGPTILDLQALFKELKCVFSKTELQELNLKMSELKNFLFTDESDIDDELATLHAIKEKNELAASCLACDSTPTHALGMSIWYT